MNELKYAHLLVIELDHPIFGLERSNIELWTKFDPSLHRITKKNLNCPYFCQEKNQLLHTIKSWWYLLIDRGSNISGCQNTRYKHVMVHVVRMRRLAVSEGHCNKADNNAISLLPFLGFGMQFELKIRKMHALFFPFFLPKADWVKGEQYQVYTYKGKHLYQCLFWLEFGFF